MHHPVAPAASDQPAALSGVDDTEELEALPMEERDADPLFGASLAKGCFLRQVEDMRLYRVRYDDMDREHLTRDQVVRHRAALAAQLGPPGLRAVRCGGTRRYSRRWRISA